jgi:hypothetical protein
MALRAPPSYDIQTYFAITASSAGRIPHRANLKVSNSAANLSSVSATFHHARLNDLRFAEGSETASGIAAETSQSWASM